MKLYHASSNENIESIIKNGFEIKESLESALGFAVYFSRIKENAMQYGKHVIEIDLDIDSKYMCKRSFIDKMPIFTQLRDSYTLYNIIEQIKQNPQNDPIEYLNNEYMDFSNIGFDESKEAIDILSNKFDFDENIAENKAKNTYIKEAKDWAEEELENGCKIVCSPSQCAIYDIDILKNIKITRI